MKICIFGDIHYIDKIPQWEVKRKLPEYDNQLTEKLITTINKEKINVIEKHLEI